MGLRFDPWAYAQLLGIRVVLKRLKDARGATDGSTIWLDPDLPLNEMRCVCAHELAHIELGRVGQQDVAGEAEADLWASDWLIEKAELAEAVLVRGDDWRAVALDLDVDMHTLSTYLDNLGPAESVRLGRLLDQHHREKSVG